MNWQPIDSAPKDGEAFLACFQNSQKDWVTFLAIAPNKYTSYNPQYERATHWHELPPPPESKE